MTNSKNDAFTSIVIPVYNEVDALMPLYERLSAAMDALPGSVEAILVNDGSTDGSDEVLGRIAALDHRFIIIHLRRNYGQTAALAAGFDHARGEVIIAMDADLQNDPADIPLLLDKLAEGYDVVSGWRKNRNDKLITRKIPSWAANC